VSRAILHVDMDAFYAAIEQRDRPELRGQPVIVGADPKGGRGRGVVSTASYEARRFGVGSAMSISEAWRRCPHGVYVPVDMAKYARVSDEIMAILGRFTDLVEPVSVDEAFLDVTGSRRIHGDGETIARKVRDAIRAETSLTASVGVAGSKLVAKIASDIRKPDGLVIVPPGGEATFLAPLPVRRLWGVGPKTEERLLTLGVHTIGDVVTHRDRLAAKLGDGIDHLVSLARGEDMREVQRDHDAKSLGQERTYMEDVDDLGRLRRTLLGLSDAVAKRLRDHGVRARTVTLKYRTEGFETFLRAETMPRPSDSGDALFDVAWGLFQGIHRGRKVRLLGVYASGLAEADQRELFPEETRPADRVRDRVTDRFGRGALTRASLLPKRNPNRG
jgi:nucleotidyltransferase/DNA polymerase involved in DNA repair